MSVKRTALSGEAAVVRRLTEAYFSEINALGSEWFDDDSYGPDIPQIVEQDLERLSSETLPEPLCLVYSGDSVAGMGQFHRHDSSLVTLKRVFVRPEHRGRGLGRLLVETMIKEATEDGFEAVRLNVSPYHERARDLYQSLGFNVVSAPQWTDVPPELHDDWQFLRRSL